ncbi:hypothetical protein DUPY_10940 [Duganella phyllosphaerae]|uniref:mRNA interferase HigB n=2 Tax=Duganella phyllosphaerae TaxID=762836 RepID=A0A1E7X517_9BURK|nr:hypothetical protein DUPY_10940 [Duganella phyllosphaerae]
MRFMRILSLQTIKSFYEQPACRDAKIPLTAWYGFVLKASWSSPAEVKADFGTAIILKNGRVVFNIAGNKYRLVTSINYPHGILFIKFIGTHKQYDAIDAQTI